MRTTLENEIRRAITDLKIEEKVKEYFGAERKAIIQKLKDIFVNGEPRVWWLSLKHIPRSFAFIQDEPYKEIAGFFKSEEEVWFVVEDADNDDQLLYKTSVSNVIDIISACSYFEYNIVSENCDKLLCENDHDEFLYIYIGENPGTVK